MNIGDLVVNLAMNSMNFQKGVATAQATVKNFAAATVSALAPVTAALAGVWGASESVSGYKSLLASQNKITAAINATGGAAGLTSQEMIALGEDLQAVSNYEDEVTHNAVAMLTSFKNIKGDQFKATVQAAADMAAIMGGDLQSSALTLGKALNDPTAGLAKLSKAGITFTDEQEKLIKRLQATGDIAGAQGVILNQVASTFGGAAAAMQDPWTQFKFALGDVADIIGATVLPSINVLLGGLTGLLTTVGSGIKWFQDFGIEVAVLLSNMGGILTLATTQWELFFVKTALDAAHFFTKAMPEYLNWFGRNWYAIFETIGSNTLTLFENLGKNIAVAWQAVLDFFQGNPMKFDFTDLREGFVNTIESLPDVPERMTTEFEKSLQQDIEAMTDHLAGSMDKQREELKASLTKSAGVVTDAAEQDQIAKPAAKSEQKTEGPAALLKGSGSALSAIFGAGRKADDRTAKATETTVAELKKLNNNVLKLNGGDGAVGGGKI